MHGPQWIPYDLQVDERCLSKILSWRDKLITIIKTDYDKKSVEFPERFHVGPKMQWPSDARRAAIVGASAKEVKVDEDLLLKSIRMTLLNTPAKKLWLRRSSGVGRSINLHLDEHLKHHREAMILSGHMFRRWSDDLVSSSVVKIHLRVEQKGKGSKEEPRIAYSYLGNQYEWVAPYDGSHRCLRPRPVYTHPGYNLTASLLYAAFDKTKYSQTTCPIFEVPVANSLSGLIGRASSYEMVDVSRMGTSIPTEWIRIISLEIARKWADFSHLPIDYFLSFLLPTVVAPNIEYRDDENWTVEDGMGTWGINDPVILSNVSAGNLDGKPGTTADNDRIFVYWLMLLRRQLKLPLYETLDDISTDRYFKAFFIGDGALITAPPNARYTANELALMLKEIIIQNSNNGDLKIESTESDTWCGYRIYREGENLIPVRDEIASLFKILAPEYPVGSTMRPNPLAGFNAMKDMWANIPLPYRTCSFETVQTISKMLDRDLRLDLAGDTNVSAEDLSLYYYHPSYVHAQLPGTYFITIEIDKLLKSMRLGFEMNSLNGLSDEFRSISK